MGGRGRIASMPILQLEGGGSERWGGEVRESERLVAVLFRLWITGKPGFRLVTSQSATLDKFIERLSV